MFSTDWQFNSMFYQSPAQGLPVRALSGCSFIWGWQPEFPGYLFIVCSTRNNHHRKNPPTLSSFQQFGRHFVLYFKFFLGSKYLPESVSRKTTDLDLSDWRGCFLVHKSRLCSFRRDFTKAWNRTVCGL